MQARLNPQALTNLLPVDLPDKDSQSEDLRRLQVNPVWRYLLQRLQRRALELALSSKPETALFDTGVAEGARQILNAIDLVLGELASAAQKG